MKSKTQPNHGFTIVELLVVIVVIGVLASIVTVAYGSVTQRARDTERLSEIASIEKALELYYTDNGGYPKCGSTGPNLSPYTLTDSIATSCLTDDLVPKYMQSIPTDPTNQDSYRYWYASGYKKTAIRSFTGTPATDNYIIGIKQETSSGPFYSGWGRSDLTVLEGSGN